MRSRKRKLCSLKGGARWIYFNRAGNFSSFFFYADLQCCDIGDDDWSSTRYVINARPFRIERKGSRVTPLSTAAIKIEIPSRGSGLHYSFQSLFGHPLIPPDSSPTCYYPVRDQGRPYPSFPLQLYPYTNFNSPPIWPCP